MFNQETTTPSRSGDTTCRVFAWCGQSFETCEDCGKPFWEHLYIGTFGQGKPDLRVKVYLSWKDGWVWKKVTIITPEQAERTRQKWDGYLEWAKNENRRSIAN